MLKLYCLNCDAEHEVEVCSICGCTCHPSDTDASKDIKGRFFIESDDNVYCLNCARDYITTLAMEKKVMIAQLSNHNGNIAITTPSGFIISNTICPIYGGKSDIGSYTLLFRLDHKTKELIDSNDPHSKYKVITTVWTATYGLKSHILRAKLSGTWAKRHEHCVDCQERLELKDMEVNENAINLQPVTPRQLLHHKAATAGFALEL